VSQIGAISLTIFVLLSFYVCCSLTVSHIIRSQKIAPAEHVPIELTGWVGRRGEEGRVVGTEGGKQRGRRVVTPATRILDK
jgi:hypothetical protein